MSSPGTAGTVGAASSEPVIVTVSSAVSPTATWAGSSVAVTSAARTLAKANDNVAAQRRKMRFIELPILSRLILRRLLADGAGIGGARQGVLVLLEGVEERLCLLRTHLAGLALRRRVRRVAAGRVSELWSGFWVCPASGPGRVWPRRESAGVSGRSWPSGSAGVCPGRMTGFSAARSWLGRRAFAADCPHLFCPAGGVLPWPSF